TCADHSGIFVRYENGRAPRCKIKGRNPSRDGGFSCCSTRAAWVHQPGTIHLVEYSAFVTLRPTMKTFENKTVLITGGTSGIGKAAALAFAKEGANVVVSGRRVAEGEKVAREIASAGGSSMFVPTDVGREDDIVA